MHWQSHRNDRSGRHCATTAGRRRSRLAALVILLVAIFAAQACQDGPRPDSTNRTVAPLPSKQSVSSSGEGVELEQVVLVGSRREPDKLVLKALAESGMLLDPLVHVVPYDVDDTGRFALVAVNTGSGVVRGRFVLLETTMAKSYRIHSQSEEYFAFETTTVLTRSGSKRSLEITESRFDRKGNERIRRGQLVWDMQ